MSNTLYSTNLSGHASHRLTVSASLLHFVPTKSENGTLRNSKYLQRLIVANNYRSLKGSANELLRPVHPSDLVHVHRCSQRCSKHTNIYSMPNIVCLYISTFQCKSQNIKQSSQWQVFLLLLGRASTVVTQDSRRSKHMKIHNQILHCACQLIIKYDSY